MQKHDMILLHGNDHHYAIFGNRMLLLELNDGENNMAVLSSILALETENVLTCAHETKKGAGTSSMLYYSSLYRRFFCGFHITFS
jgi:hypothetical protein